MRYAYERRFSQMNNASRTIHHFVFSVPLFIVSMLSLIITGVMLYTVYYDSLPALNGIIGEVLAGMAILWVIAVFLSWLNLIVTVWAHNDTLTHLEEHNPSDVQRESEFTPGLPPRWPDQFVSIPKLLYYPASVTIMRPGQVLMGMRPDDDSLRFDLWEQQKTVLVVGQTGSGKTMTLVSRAVDAVKNGAWLVVCDPFGDKKRSLLQTIEPLKPFLLPETLWAIEREQILQNVRLVRQLLEQRIEGEPITRPVILLVDEWNHLMRDEEIACELTSLVQAIEQEGCKCSMYGVFAAQRVTGNADLRKSMGSFIVHRCDRSEAQLVISARFAKLSPELQLGRAWVRDAAGLTELLQQAILTVQDVEQIARIISQQFWA